MQHTILEANVWNKLINTDRFDKEPFFPRGIMREFPSMLSYFLAACICATTPFQNETVNLALLNGCQIQQRVVSQRLRQPDKPHFTLYLHFSFKVFVYYCKSAM